MRKFLRFAATALLVNMLAAGWAVAGPIQLQTGVRFEFTNCASGGSANQTITDGNYLLRVIDETVFICYAATCVNGGEAYPAGTVILLKICSSNMCSGNGTVTSCRSANSTGDAIFTRGTN